MDPSAGSRPTRASPHAASDAADHVAPASNNHNRIRRRNRLITSCLECRRRKLKCDRAHPCTNCSKARRDCLFLAPALDSDARLKLTEIKEKMGRLERSLEQDVAGKRSGADIAAKDDPAEAMFGAAEERANLPIPDDEKDLEPTPLAVLDAAYEDEADDDIYDLGFRVGKMRMTDRVGGYFRPRFADELSAGLRKLHISAEPESSEPTPKERLERLSAEERDAYFSPGPSYIAPSSEIMFGPMNRDYVFAEHLPSKTVTDRLMEQYWLAVHPVARVVHRPSFEKRYQVFWDDINKGFEPTPSLQALVLAALFTAVASMPEPEVFRLFGVTQKELRDDFQLATEAGLRKAHILRTTKTETMKAFVMYLLPMCRGEISRSHSALVGLGIRLAECMGFHRDASEYGHGPVETHVRRLIWYQLCFMDLRTSEVQGPRACIRREDYSTLFPLNLNDEDFTSGRLDDVNRWTDMTFSRIRFECQEITRVCLADRLRLEKRLISLTHLMGKIESFRKAMYAKYEPLYNVPNATPIQRAAEHMLGLWICRLYIAVLQRYHSNPAAPIPDRLRQVMLTAAAQHLDHAVQLDTAPELQPWVWYSRAYDQYHIAFLLLFDVFMVPMRRDADRIWRCLDYVYEIGAEDPLSEANSLGKVSRQELIARRNQKALRIITQVKDRLEIYSEMRKLRFPKTMAEQNWLETCQAKQTPPPLQSKSQKGKSPMTDAKMSRVQSPPDIPNPVQPRRGNEQQQRPSNSPPQSTESFAFSIMLPAHENVEKARQNMAAAHSQKGISTPPQQGLPSLDGPYHDALYYPASGAAPAVQPPISTPGGSNRAVRGESLESDGSRSSDSGGPGLWFVPGGTDTSGGTAPTPGPVGLTRQEDMPMPDIDWTEWDKLFPPDINTGDLNFPPQVLEIPSNDPSSMFYHGIYHQGSNFPFSR
ncbi:transcriptional regulator family: Fungal Specific TF [Paecilomyces variotii]|nr:transcriptional regulator family: Fungal Specific TF [Paecilomyces variotii]